MKYAAGGSSVALTVISPIYGSSNGSSSLAPPPLHYSPFGMPSALHPSSGSPAGSAPPPPPPPPIMTTPTGPSRGLHHQPSMRVGITSPQPVGVYIGRDKSFFFSFYFVWFLFCFFLVKSFIDIPFSLPFLLLGVKRKKKQKRKKKENVGGYRWRW